MGNKEAKQQNKIEIKKETKAKETVAPVPKKQPAPVAETIKKQEIPQPMILKVEPIKKQPQPPLQLNPPLLPTPPPVIIADSMLVKQKTELKPQIIQPQIKMTEQSKWRTSFFSKTAKNNEIGIKIKSSKYQWIIFGLIHSSCKEIQTELYWNEACVFFNVGSDNFWAFGDKMEVQSTQHELDEAIVMKFDLKEGKFVWKQGDLELGSFSIKKPELSKGQWTPFFSHFNSDEVQWCE